MKFRAGVLALDPCAKLFTSGNPLEVTHSRCGGKFIQKATNDLSSFRDHVSICQSISPGLIAPVRPVQVHCPGFSLSELCGKLHETFPYHENKRLAAAMQDAGLAWLGSTEKLSIVSKWCLKKSPSYKEPARPCENCLMAIERSNIKERLVRISTSEPKYEFCTLFKPMDATTTATREGKGDADVS